MAHPAWILLMVHGMITLLEVVGPPQDTDAFQDRCRRALTQADALRLEGEIEEAHALLEPLAREARELGDATSLLPILALQGRMWAAYGQARQAEEAMREAKDLAETLKDTTYLCMALRWLAVAVEAQGRADEAHTLYQRLLALAREAGDRHHEAWALVGIAWKSLQEGDASMARQEYKKAVALFRELEDERSEIWVLNGLGMSLQQLGAFEEALACYSRCAELAGKIHYHSAEADALNNLGSLEYFLGDPGRAEQYFHRAYDLHRADGFLRSAVIPAGNVALCLTMLGRFHDAAEILAELLEDCREQGYAGLEAKVLILLGQTRSSQGRPREAASLFRQALSLEPPPGDEAEALIGLSEVLIDMEDADEALTVLAEQAALLEGRLEPSVALHFSYNLGRRLMTVGRNEEALDRMEEVCRRADELGMAGYRISALFREAQCHRALDRPDRAMELLLRAAGLWEAERRIPQDPEWRERIGVWAREIYGDLADLLLRFPPETPEGRRTAEAFDTLQRFKARTLNERMHGPAWHQAEDRAHSITPPVTLEKLQQEVLEDGELFLDAFLGPDTTILFAVTGRTCRAIRLPGERETLGARFRLCHDLLAAPPPAAAPAAGLEEAIETACRSLGQELLQEVADLLEGAHRVILAPDGLLNLIPLGGLHSECGEPLISRVEVVRIPSATILAGLRSRTANRRPKDGVFKILALTGDRGVREDTLPGAEWEVRHLARRYREVDLRLPAGAGGRPLSIEELMDYDVLHFAAHTVLDDQYPWRSGILMAAGAGQAKASYLRASEIASRILPARMAVLSGCESAGGRILSGEGVLGLTGAFLGAGVPAVVASLWPVDDRATARLMTAFYASLSKGETAASSLRRAQLALKAAPSTRHPFYWAGFVLVGDGDVRVPLDTKNPWKLYGLLALFFLFAAMVPVFRRKR